MAAEILSSLLKSAVTDKIESLKQTGKEISEKGIKEYTKGQIENLKDAEKNILAKLDDIKNLTPEQLQSKLQESLQKVEDNSNKENVEENVKENFISQYNQKQYTFISIKAL